QPLNRVFSSSGVFSRLASETSAELRFPFVDAGVTDAILAEQIADGNAGLMHLQNADDLLFRKATALLALVRLGIGSSLSRSAIGMGPMARSSFENFNRWAFAIDRRRRAPRGKTDTLED